MEIFPSCINMLIPVTFPFFLQFHSLKRFTFSYCNVVSWISSTSSNRHPFKLTFSFRKRIKSHGERETKIVEWLWYHLRFYIWGVFKKRPNFLNSVPTSTESALRLLSTPCVRFWQQTAICPIWLWTLVVELHPLNWARAQAVRQISDKVTMKELVEQCVCVCVKFCYKLGKNLQTFQLLNEAYRKDCMSQMQCNEWFKCFKEGRMSVGEDPTTWMTFHINKQRPCQESWRCDSWKSLFNCLRSCWRNGHQHRILPSNFY